MNGEKDQTNGLVNGNGLVFLFQFRRLIVFFQLQQKKARWRESDTGTHHIRTHWLGAHTHTHNGDAVCSNRATYRVHVVWTRAHAANAKWKTKLKSNKNGSNVKIKPLVSRTREKLNCGSFSICSFDLIQWNCCVCTSISRSSSSINVAKKCARNVWMRPCVSVY